MSKDDEIYDDDEYYDEDEEDLDDDDDEEVRSSRPSVNPFGSSSSGSLPGRDRFGSSSSGPGSGSGGSSNTFGSRPSGTSPFSRPSSGSGTGQGNPSSPPPRFGQGSSPSSPTERSDRPSGGSGLPGRDPKDVAADRARFFGSSGSGNPSSPSSGSGSGSSGASPRPFPGGSGDRPAAPGGASSGSGFGGNRPAGPPGGSGSAPGGGSGSSFGTRFGGGSAPGSGSGGETKPGPSAPVKDAPKDSPKKEDDKSKPPADSGAKSGGLGASLGGLAARSPFGGGAKKEEAGGKPADKKDDKGGGKPDSKDAPKSGGLGGLAARSPFGGGAKKDDAGGKPADKKDDKGGSKPADKSASPAAALGGLTSRLPFGGGAKKDDAGGKPADKKGDKGADKPADKAAGPAAALGGLTSRLPFGGRAKKDDAGGKPAAKDAPAKPAGTARTGDKPAEESKSSPLGRFRGGAGAAGAPPAAAPKGDAKPKSATRAAEASASGGLLSRINVFARPQTEKSTRTSKTRASKIPQTSAEGMSLDTQLDILGVGLIFGALVIFFSSLSGEQGAVTAAINNFFLELLGRGLLGVPAAMLAIGVWLIVRHFGDEAPVVDPVRIGGVLMLYVGILMIFQYLDSFRSVYAGVDIPTYRLLVDPLTTSLGIGGGRIGAELYILILSTVGDVASVFVILCWMTIGLMLATRTTAAEIAIFVISVYRSFVVAMQRRAQRAAAKRAEAQLLAAQQAEAAKLLAAQQQAQIAVSKPTPEALPAPAAAALPATTDGDGTPGVPIEQRDILIRVAGQALPAAGQPAAVPPAPPHALPERPAAAAPPAPAAAPSAPPAGVPAPAGDSGGRLGGFAARLRGGTPTPKPQTETPPAKEPAGGMRFFRRTETPAAPEASAPAAQPAPVTRPPVPDLPATQADSTAPTPTPPETTRPASPAVGASPARPSPFSRPTQPPSTPAGDHAPATASPASPFSRPTPASAPGARPSPFERASAALGATPTAPAETAKSDEEALAKLPPAQPKGVGPAPRPQPTSTFASRFSAPPPANTASSRSLLDDDEDLDDDEQETRKDIRPFNPNSAASAGAAMAAGATAGAIINAATDSESSKSEAVNAATNADEAPAADRLNRLNELRSGQISRPASDLRAVLDDEDLDDEDLDDDYSDDSMLDEEEGDDGRFTPARPAASGSVASGPARPTPFSPRPFTPPGSLSGLPATPAGPARPAGESQPAAAARPFSPFVSRPGEKPNEIPNEKPNERPHDAPAADVTQRPTVYTPPSVAAGTPPTPATVPPPERKTPQVMSPGGISAAPPSAGPVINTAPAPQSVVPPRQRRQWRLPDYRSLLASGSEQDFDRQMLVNKARTIEETLQSFGAPGRVVEINTGPVITQFGVEPDYLLARGGKKNRVKVSAIAQLDKDLQLALGARSIRIEAPVPGKGYVGVEVPNDQASLVSLRDVMESKQFTKIKSPLAIALGQSVDGTPVAADLASMPHLLIAGTTGSGKSVCVNSVITSLILQNTPDVVKFIMVDPKRVELTGYNGIPHLVAPVVVELERIVGVLKWVTREMDERYKKFSEAGARNIEDYNTHLAEHLEPMPYIVVIIDELADLMMLAPDETERVITRIAALARATGIHLVIATQRPSVDVVTGLIKANFPARIAFAVAGSVDSRVILDQPGAERLLGRGDMLYMSGDSPAPLRLQGVYVSDMEINNVTRFWRTQQPDNAAQKPITALVMDGPPQEARSVIPRGERFMQPPPASTQSAFWDEDRPSALTAAVSAAAGAAPSTSSGSGGEGGVDDELYGEAVEMVRKLGKASVSLLQRRLRIGYTRAARLIDVMEAQGIIGPPTEGSKPREVLPIKK